MKEKNASLTWDDILELARNGNPSPNCIITKTDDEWAAELTSEVFEVTRQKGTEMAYSSDMCTLFEPGRYVCNCCGTELFDAAEKFQSNSGWPSFTQPIKANAVAYESDRSYGMQRIEATCNSCQAHLGHVFPDGPPPSSLRYCINALSLRKVAS